MAIDGTPAGVRFEVTPRGRAERSTVEGSGAWRAVWAASRQAPAATATLIAIPIHVVARSPTAGTSQKPDVTAPIAAPAVFAAYSAPAPDALRAHHATTIG